MTRVDVGLQERVGRRTRHRLTGLERGDRAGDRADLVVGDVDARQHDVAGVGHHEAVADRVAGVGAVAVEVVDSPGLLVQRDRRGARDRCVGGVGRRRRGHARRRSAGGGGTVGDVARVHVGLRQRVGRGAGRGLARLQRRDRAGHRADLGVGDADVGQRDVAGVLDGERVADRVTHVGPVAVDVGDRPGDLVERDRRGPSDGRRHGVGGLDVGAGRRRAGRGRGVDHGAGIHVGLGQRVGLRAGPRGTRRQCA